MDSTRRRVLTVAFAIVLVPLIAVPAFRSSEGWWFLGSGAPLPASNVGEVASGRSADIDWSVTAYLSEGQGICIALTPDVGRRDMGGASCGHGVRGEPNRAAIGVRRERHWVGWTYFALGLFDFPQFVFGPVANGVTSVDIVLSNGHTLHLDTIEGPDELSAPMDFYVGELPRGVSVSSIAARDSSGTVLERRRPRFTAP